MCATSNSSLSNHQRYYYSLYAKSLTPLSCNLGLPRIRYSFLSLFIINYLILQFDFCHRRYGMFWILPAAPFRNSLDNAFFIAKTYTLTLKNYSVREFNISGRSHWCILHFDYWNQHNISFSFFLLE